MKANRSIALVLAAMLAGIAPQAEALVMPLPDLSESISAPAPVVAPDYIIEAVYPIGQADDGDCLDMVVCVEPQTHTRVVYIVKSPLGLEKVEVSDSGEVFWVIERDWLGSFNDEQRWVSVGMIDMERSAWGLSTRVSGSDVRLHLDFGGGTVALGKLKKAAAKFWRRPGTGSVMDPQDLSNASDSTVVQDAAIRHYLSRVFPTRDGITAISTPYQFRRHKLSSSETLITTSAAGIVGNAGGGSIGAGLVLAPEGFFTKIVGGYISSFGLFTGDT